MSRKIKLEGLDSYHWSEISTVIDELLKYADFNSNSEDKDICFVGFTNGYQLSHATEREGGEGAFYSDSSNDCYIPLYILKSHLHRVETTTDGNVTPESIGLLK